MIRLDAVDLRALADTLDTLERLEIEHKVALVGHDRSGATAPSGEVVAVNRVNENGSRDPDGPARYVVEIEG